MQVCFSKDQVDRAYREARAAVGEVQCLVNEVAAQEADYLTAKHLVAQAREIAGSERLGLAGIDSADDGGLIVSLGPRYG